MHRWSIGLQSSADLDFEETFSYLLQRALETVFVGKCFAFTFQHPIPLENHSKCSLTHYGRSSSNKLIATSVKALGSVSNSTDVITVLKHHFTTSKPIETDLHIFGEALPSSVVHSPSTTPSQCVVIPSCNTRTTVGSSQENSTSFLYESMHVSESHEPHQIQFVSYCDPSTDFSLSTPSLETCYTEIWQSPSGGVAIKDVSQAPLALPVSAGLLRTHMHVVVTPEHDEHSIISSEAVDLEILQELISDWECSQNEQDNSMTSSDVESLLSGPGPDSFSYDTRTTEDPKCGVDSCRSLDHQPDVSLSNFSEDIIAELQSSFNRSVYPTSCGSVGKQKGCSSLNSSAAYAPLTGLRSTPYNSPELFSSTSSLAPTSRSNRKATLKQPPLYSLTWVSPEMFDNSELSLQTTPFQASSHSHRDRTHCIELPNHYFTPAVHRHGLSLPRRNILGNISNTLPDTQQAAMVEPTSKPYLLDSPSNSPQMQDHAGLCTTPSGQLVEDNHFATSSPDLFSQINT